MSVLVIGLNGRPLMPTTTRKARILLKEQKASVICRHPFTIHLWSEPGGLQIIRSIWPASVMPAIRQRRTSREESFMNGWNRKNSLQEDWETQRLWISSEDVCSRRSRELHLPMETLRRRTGSAYCCQKDMPMMRLQFLYREKIWIIWKSSVRHCIINRYENRNDRCRKQYQEKAGENQTGKQNGTGRILQK